MMKRTVALCLILFLLLGLSACGAGAGDDAPKTFQVGFGRASIHPTAPIALAGYGGNTTAERTFEGMLDYLYATCVAITDENGETILLYTLDIINVITDWVPDFRAAVTEATGVPAERIMLSATHTHSAPDVISAVSPNTPYYTVLKNGIAEAGKLAMEDRANATLSTASATVPMNCVRHYVQPDGMYFGDNFGKQDPAQKEGTKPVTESDKQMQLIRVTREGDKKDIVMVNYQGHPKVASTNGTYDGRQTRKMVSADYVGFTRMYLEEQEDVLFAFYLGASGNLNPHDASDLGTANPNMPQKVQDYSKMLTGYITEAMANTKEVATPTIKTKQTSFAGQLSGNRGERSMEINAITMGDISFVTVPFEMFDTNGMEVKTGSPTATTFVLSCANGRFQYMPSQGVWDYKTVDGSVPYELSSCQFERGTGEAVAQELVNMLQELAK